jgi:hypothetical protein
MKFLKSHNVKYSSKLFQGKYKYKVVFTSGVAGWFRGSNAKRIQNLYNDKDGYHYYARQSNPGDKLHANKLAVVLESIESWQARVETPFVSIYLNSEADLELVVKNCKNRVKYVEIPDPNNTLELTEGTVLVKNLDYGFKVSIGTSNQNHSNFVQWCQNNGKIRLPKRAAKDLSKDHNPGGGFFYVKDDKSLIMVKMFLGRTITKVETVVKV